MIRCCVKPLTGCTILVAVNQPMELRRAVFQPHRQARASTSATKHGSASYGSLDPVVVDYR